MELAADGKVVQCLPPAPNDALLLESRADDDRHAVLNRLVPLKLESGMRTDLPDLQPVGLLRPDPRKPHKYAPGFWFWEQYEKWLQAPSGSAPVTLAELGHDGPTREQRMHVTISDGQGTAEEGALFQTQGLEFTRPAGTEPSLGGTKLALALAVEDDRIAPGLAPLGGERRLAHWREADEWSLPTCPQTIRDSILATRSCRVLLLTPATLRRGTGPLAVPRRDDDPSDASGGSGGATPNSVRLGFCKGTTQADPTPGPCWLGLLSDLPAGGRRDNTQPVD